MSSIECSIPLTEPSMARHKQYEMLGSRQPVPVQGLLSDERARASQLLFAEVLAGPMRNCKYVGVDLSAWMARGVDQWVWATISTLTHLLRSGTRAPVSINDCGRAMKKFFEFLSHGRPHVLVSEPAVMAPLHITQFIAWLQRWQESNGFSAETTRAVYKGVKTVLVAMMDLGVVKAEPKSFFPASALPHGNALPTSAQPYSDAEQQRIALALKADLVDIHHGRVQLNGSNVMTTYYLIVAMRSGANVTPLLEIERDDLKPGLLPGTRYLQLRKHRGGKVIRRLAGPTQTVLERPTNIPVDAAAVVEKALAETTHLVAQAPAHLRNRIWLYRSVSQSEGGAIKCLNTGTLRRASLEFAVRRNLLDDAGNRLVISTRRLRRSLGKRAWRLSEGDPLAVAAVLGNSPRVADHHYLRMDEQLQAEAAKYLQHEMSARMRSGHIKLMVADSAVDGSPTPVGRCKDSMHGAHAPKNGSHHCDQFVLCLSCPSFAIVGEPDDLWRLYSFQRFAEQELAALDDTTSEAAGTSLRDLYQAAIPFIDRFCEQSFGVARAAAARDRARQDAHPFWKLQSAWSAQRRQREARPDRPGSSTA
jgi:hypothetical protein